MTHSGMSVGYRSPEYPSVFTCADFEGACCEDCHKQNFVIAIYPWSVYSEGKRDRMPDLSMGLRAEVCCAKFHIARELPRGWWIRKYCERQRWSAEDTEILVKASEDSHRYLKTAGELASKYFKLRENPVPVARTIRKRIPTCPNCENVWNEVVCDNCGYVS